MVFVYEYSNYQLLLPENPKEGTELIQFGIPTDIWFQVENSAKSTPCYLRPISNQYDSLDAIPPSVLKQVALAIKSHTNYRRDPISLIYTFVSNINSNGPINKQNVNQRPVKVKQEVSPEVTVKRKKLDLESQKLEWERETRTKNFKNFKQNKQSESEANKKYMMLAEQKRRGYDFLLDDDLKAASSNQNRDENWEDDFM